MANTKTKTVSVIEGTDAEAFVSINNTSEEAVIPEKPIVPKEVDLNTYITVYNGFHGILNYRSKRTGELFSWESFGDDKQIELRELKDAKSSNKKMFINNWFMFDKDDSWVIDYLGVKQYYKHAIAIDEFDNIFKLTPAKLKAAIKEMSDGQKKSVLYRAATLIASGDIDSRKTIAALEEALGVELIEQ